MKLRLLRLALGFSAFAWGVAVFGVLAPWSTATALLETLGARPVPEDPMLDYWMRMAAGVFALVGVLFLVLAFRPHEHRAIIPWFGGLMLVEGLILLVHGLRLHLPPVPFVPDTVACLGAGVAILYLCQGTLEDEPSRSGTPETESR